MDEGAPVNLLLLVISGLALCWGLWLVRRSRRRVGDTPHCRACDYDLTGKASDVCPECGLALGPVGNIVHGDAVRLRGRFARGLLLIALALVLGGTIGTYVVRTYEWYRLRPVGWVIDDAASRDPRDATRAWNELARRIAGGRLSDAAHARLTRLALDEQANAEQAHPPRPATPLVREFVGYLGDRALAGKLDPGQEERFFDALLRLQVRLRRLVRAGDAFPVEVRTTWGGPIAGGWWVQTGARSITVGDKKEIDGQGGDTFSGLGGGSTTLDLAGRPAGDYPVTVRETARVYHGPTSDPSASRLVHEAALATTATVHVVAAEPPDTFRLLDKPELLPAVRAAVVIDRFGLRNDGKGGRSVELRIGLMGPPENLVLDVTARIGGKDYYLGVVHVGRGGQTSWYVGADLLRDLEFDKADFHFRANEKAARATVDYFDIWNGEFVIKDVPFVRPNP